MANRDENRRRFPYQYEGRRARSARVNQGTKRNWLGDVTEAGIDVRESTGDRVFSHARYTKGRHPSESVNHYRARIGGVL